MNVVIIAPDNRVCVDGSWRTVSVDLPGIVSVRFNGETAKIEHFSEEPSTLTADEFQARYGSIVSAWEQAPEDDAVVRNPSAQQAQADDGRVAALEAQLASVTAALEIIRRNVVGG